MVKAEVKVLNGGPTLLINSKPVFPMLYLRHPSSISAQRARYFAYVVFTFKHSGGILEILLIYGKVKAS
jgi:hypothetical protein